MSSRFQSAFVVSALGLGVGLGAAGAGAQPLSLETEANILNARLGGSVASTETLAVVGAPADDGPGGADQGAAYIYIKSGSSWVFLDKLVDPSGRGGDNFGQSVGITADGKRIVIGAPGSDTGSNSNHGAAHVFEHDGGWWQYRTRLAAASPQAESRLGSSVAISGQTIVAGAPLYDDGATADAGAVYVITLSGAAWTTSNPFTVSSLGRGRLGTSVDIDGTSIIVGAPAANSGRGAAALITLGSAGLTLTQTVASTDATASQAFGSSVSIEGATAAIGAPNDPGPAGGAQGAVYVFQPDIRFGWRQVFKGRAGDGRANDRLGTSIAVVGGRIIAGSPGSDLDNVNNCGAAYIFHYVSFPVGNFMFRAWLQAARINPTFVIPEISGFGAAVGGTGSTYIIGSPVESPRFEEGMILATGAGSATVFTFTGQSVTERSRLDVPDAFPRDYFVDHPVAISGNFAVVGSPTGLGPSGAGQGFAHILQRANGQWYLRKRLYNPSGAAGLGFGRSVAISGSTVVVCQDGQAVIFEGFGVNSPAVTNLVGTAGAFGVSAAVHSGTILVGSHRTAGGEQGSVSVYSGGNGSWSLAATLTNLDGGVGGFGRAVAIKGSVAVVGASTQVVSGIARGAAHVYVRGTSGVWSRQTRLIPSSQAAGSEFGHSVSVDIGTIVVGAPRHGRGGAAFVFRATASKLVPWASAGTLVGRGGGEFGRSVAVSGNFIAVGGDESAQIRFFCRLPGSTTWQAIRSHQAFHSGGSLTVALDSASVIVSEGKFGGYARIRIHCPGDFNMDGIITATDASLFANRFAAGDARADFDDSGSVTPSDATAYNAAFGAGCP